MKSMLEYRGYHASVEYDAEDDILIGEVFGISDSLNFHGQSISEIKEMFKQSIDNYLEICEKLGKNPDKEFKGTFNVRISPENHKKAALEAKKRKITLNQFVSDAIEHEITTESVIKEIINTTKVVKSFDINNDVFDNYSKRDVFTFSIEKEIRDNRRISN